jgi:AcrR family transcriptional regulator
MDSENPDRGAKKRTLRERFREETAREILIAAEQVFTEQGLSGAAMSMIAERAGVAVGTLYNRFKDREALLGALLDDRREELLERLDEALAEAAAEDLRTRLHAFVLTLLLELEEHAQSGREKMPRALRERLDTLWKSPQAARQLRRDAEQAFSGLLLAMVKGTMERERYGLPALEPAAAAALIVDFFMRGAGR